MLNSYNINISWEIRNNFIDDWLLTKLIKYICVNKIFEIEVVLFCVLVI